MRKLIKEFKVFITGKDQDNTYNSVINESKIYGLPNIHKSSEIQSAANKQKRQYRKIPRSTDLKLRPIFAGP